MEPIAFSDFMVDFMAAAGEQFTYLANKFGPGIFIPTIIFVGVGVMAQWALYEKCGLPGYACLVPVWNVIVFLKIMGRPAAHIWYFIVPIVLAPIVLVIMDINYLSLGIVAALLSFLLIFTIRVYIELCHCFGKNKWYDYLLVVFFNGIYILTLGLSYQVVYKGPVFRK